ncbi:hypothetical protein B0T26DRAFT_757152 [Lasiosphaeria miniovina]|uniref:F-box domain-containing protein n=1 Tax=Lasiosphaeria miniovina TaxID=1954250 RepID=A0AA40DKX7_9PEZI|nr:uncharacterized protein B0T26DRAFT_757152 [Lasiosphaeria miniovina]KAK0703623.1 hypothetical protein B0T26DRAFT_757152 [Lasiosphaeria miniovina]
MFPPEIVLAVAEFADLETVSALSRLCRSYHHTILGYQSSVIQAKLNRRGVYPLLLSPRGTTISTASPERRILPPHTFAVIQELDKRSRYIDAMAAVGGPLLKELCAHARPLDDDEIVWQRLVGAMRHGCLLADRLADCVVDLTEGLENDEEETMNVDPGSETKAEGSTSNNLRDGLPAGTAKTADAAAAPTTRDVHLGQLRLILSLSIADLCCLYMASFMSGSAYSRAYISVWDPACWEREFSFREAFLRRGSVVLWSILPRKRSPNSSSSDDDSRVGCPQSCRQRPLAELFEAEMARVRPLPPPPLPLLAMPILREMRELEREKLAWLTGDGDYDALALLMADKDIPSPPRDGEDLVLPNLVGAVVDVFLHKSPPPPLPHGLKEDLSGTVARMTMMFWDGILTGLDWTGGRVCKERENQST